jgi:hypothetical protein
MQSGSNRPLGVVVISVLELVVALYMLAISSAVAHGRVSGGAPGAAIPLLADRAPYLAMLAVIPTVLSIGLWLMQNWARIITLLISLLVLANAAYPLMLLAAFYKPESRIPLQVFYALMLRTALSASIAIYLFHPRVARAFHEAY